MFDIISYCSNYGIDYALKGKNIGSGWVGLQCPFHDDDGYHLGFNAAGGYFYCWKCGGHSVASVIKQQQNCSFYEANRILDSFDTSYVLLDSLNIKKKGNVSNIELPGEPLGKLEQRYLRSRGFDPEYIEKAHGVRSGGITGEWKYRLIIPIYQDGVLVSYQGRDVTGSQELRYKTLAVEKSVVDPKKCLYGLDKVRGNEYIIVSEGIFDAWKLGNNAVATLGTSTTETQIQRMARYRKVYIVFDPEAPAQERATKLGAKVGALGAEVIIVNTELDHDPGDMTEAEVSVLRKNLEIV